jgi:tetratricopeptide (TPR) repeat protein
VVIVETGCMEDPDNWGGNGCSTILFDRYIETHPGSVAYSFEIAPEKIEQGKIYCPDVDFHCGDSVDRLKLLAATGVQIDLLYLDASHHNWMWEAPSQVHHYDELMAAMPALRASSLVAVDDSLIALDDYPQNKVIGKGALVAQYAFEVGAELQFCDYQVGFTKMTGSSPIEVDHIDSLIFRARELVEKGCMLAADRLYRLIIHVTAPPWTGRARIARGEACAHFANYAHRMNKFGIAIDWYFMALEADPLAVEYRRELARSMVSIGALGPARRQASIATDIDPANPGVWQTLGGVESDLMHSKACIEAYDKQVETASAVVPVDPFALSDAYLNRATIALDTKDYDWVRELCQKIVELEVRAGDAWHVLAMLEYRLSNHEMAIDLFDKALAANCRNQPLMHWNKALPLESIGRYREGRIEAYWAEKEMTMQALYIPQHRFNAPKWRGEPPPATIHVHAEAGFGDNISMFRYFPLLLERGYKVHYEADPLMLSFVQRNFPDVVCMPRTLDYPGVVGIKPFDYHIPIGDLPYTFGTDLDTIPWDGPYLKADPELSREFAAGLGCYRRRGRRIGLCWSSGVRTTVNIWMEKYGRMKSMRFRDLQPMESLFNEETFISLQVGDGRDENCGTILDVLPESPTWDETAALIDNLDLVITVDTGVAHLAGAMGKPCWVMMQRDGSSWHFMCYRPGASWNETSPWYPSIRLFRQHEFNQPGYWKDVVDDVVKALQEPMQQAAE